MLALICWENMGLSLPIKVKTEATSYVQDMRLRDRQFQGL